MLKKGHIVVNGCIFNRLALFAIVGFSLAHSNVGADQSICLTCHQYPGLVTQKETGLVRFQDKGGLKVLNIDEANYLASPHGKLDCVACHQDINKIPHVGENKTTCQTADCHNSAKDKKLLANTSHKDFHEQEHTVITRLEDETSCKVCHQIYPHSKHPFVRALLNMHTGYMVCEVCHLDREKHEVERYGWVHTSDVQFHGKPFGSFYDPLKKLTHTPDTTLSRIAPIIKQNGELSPLMNTWDTDGAIEVCKKVNTLSEIQKSVEIKRYHRDVVKMEQTTACEECHSEKGLIDFRSLGFSKERTDILINLNIGNIIKKYDVFYMPEL